MRGAGVVFIAAMLAATIAAAQAQAVNPPQGASPAPATVTPPADTMAVPGFWDPRRRPERPDLSRISIIRFLLIASLIFKFLIIGISPLVKESRRKISELLIGVN